MKTSTQTIELLAPAGDWECLQAAVANGADAVYFGLPAFNARAKAANVPLEDLPVVMDYLHAHNVKGYVALNTLIFSPELPQAADYVAHVASGGADAVIVQDLGLAALIRRMAPTLPIHASTQMSQTEPAGIELLAALGVSRVILARELSLEQIAAIRAATGMELEVFIHGALCISVSGQCLASESLWGRSANRGQCGQACRLPYQLVVDGEPRIADTPLYPLSPLDLAAHEHVAELVRLGAAALKIEGRLKSAHYVAAATATYRAAIDAALKGKPFRLDERQQYDLAQSFSRGFTSGFAGGANHHSLVSGRFPKSRGVRLGAVVEVTDASVVIELDEAARREGLAEEPIKPGDGVVFDQGHPELDEQGGRVYSVQPLPGRRGEPCRVEMMFGPGDVDLSAVAVGSVVWKTDDPQLRRRMEQTYSRDLIVRKTPIDFDVLAQLGRPLEVVARDARGHEASACALQPLEAAMKHPLTRDLLVQQLDRLGPTPFSLGEVRLLCGGAPQESVAVMAPKSVLNELRRQVVEELTRVHLAGGRHEIADPDALAHLRNSANPPPQAASPAQTPIAADAPAASVKLSVLARTMEQVSALAESHQAGLLEPVLVYCDLMDDALNLQAFAAVRQAGLAAGLVTPRILLGGEEPRLYALAAAGPAAIIVRNLGAMSLLRRRHPQAPLVADQSLNAANELGLSVLAGQGAARITPACDLNFVQLQALVAHSPPRRPGDRDPPARADVPHTALPLRGGPDGRQELQGLPPPLPAPPSAPAGPRGRAAPRACRRGRPKHHLHLARPDRRRLPAGPAGDADFARPRGVAGGIARRGSRARADIRRRARRPPGCRRCVETPLRRQPGQAHQGHLGFVGKGLLKNTPPTQCRGFRARGFRAANLAPLA